MFNNIKETVWEVLRATLPIILAVLALNLLVVQVPFERMVEFSTGAVCVIAGMILFLLGIRVGMLPLGQSIGAALPNLRLLPYILAVVFLIGFATTVAEPDVIVLSMQVEAVSQETVSFYLLLAVIGIGIGLFMCLAFLRILFGWSLRVLMTICYVLVLMLSFFVPPNFIPVSFDAGGVTTGPLTVPVILSLGIGFSSVLARRSTISDGFGLIGIASVGPIIGVMLLGIILS